MIRTSFCILIPILFLVSYSYADTQQQTYEREIAPHDIFNELRRSFSYRPYNSDPMNKSSQVTSDIVITKETALSTSTSFQLTCRSDNGEARLLISTKDGLPYGYVGTAGAYFTEPEGDGLRFFPGLTFLVDLTANGATSQSISLYTDRDKSHYSFNLNALCMKAVKKERIWNHSILNDTYRLNTYLGTQLLITKSRRYGNYGRTLERISIIKRPWGGCTIHNMSLRPHRCNVIAQCNELIITNALGPVRLIEVNDKNVLEAFPYHKPELIADILSKKEIREFGDKWLEQSSRKYFDRGDIELPLTSIEKIRSGKADPQDSAEIHLLKLYDCIEKVYALQRNPTRKEFSLMSGWDPDYANGFFHWTFGPNNHNRTRSLLAEIVQDESFSQNSRLQAAYYLGIVGLPDREQYSNISSHLDDNEALQAMLATTAFRAKYAVAKDCDLVRKYALEKNDNLMLTAACIEACFLSGQTEGISDAAEALLSTESYSNPYVDRCLSAATCCPAGRQLIFKALLDQWPSCNTNEGFIRAMWSTPQDMPEWQEFLDLSERIYFDKGYSFEVRKKAAGIAQLRDTNDEKRSAFLRKAILVDRKDLVPHVLFSFLLLDKSADKYLEEISTAFKGADINTQRLILTALSRCLPESLSDENQRLLEDLCNEADNVGDMLLVGISSVLRKDYL